VPITSKLRATAHYRVNYRSSISRFAF